MKVLFWIAAAFVAYTYLGYACWLRLRLLWRHRPVLRGEYSRPVSIVMVVRNEEQLLHAKLQNLLALNYPGGPYPAQAYTAFQIVVVSDGSTDRTESILRKYADDSRVQTILNQVSLGKASGLNDALQVVSGEVVVFTDVRQTIEREALRLLMENFADPTVGCVSGELMLGDSAEGESAQGMGLYWRIEKQIRQLEAATGSMVGATGALYAVRRELLTEVPVGTILDDVYLPMQVVRQGKRAVFDSRARAWDSPDLGVEREFSRKVRTLSGNYQLVQLAPWLLNGSNPIRFEFISHKLLRLAVPLGLALLLAASLFLHGAFYRVALMVQLFFYVLSAMAIGGVLKSGWLARLADASGTVVVLNGAAVMAFVNFAGGRRAVWTR